MYADHLTDSMKQALSETERRRSIQRAYNETHGIIPQSIRKEVVSIFDTLSSSRPKSLDQVRESIDTYVGLEDMEQSIQQLEEQMMAAAKDLEFERAAELRDRIQSIRARFVFNGNV